MHRLYGGKEQGAAHSLKFNPLSIFEPDWKLDSGGLTDSERIFLSGDLAGTLPQDKEIYVRRNREGTFNLNIVLEDGGPNMVNSVKCVPMGYQSATLSEPEWSCDFWSSGLSVITPVRRQLDRLGISVDYSDGRFSFRVSDPKRFVAGRRVPLSLYLYPGEVEVRAVIVTAEDLLVEESGGLKLDEDFYIGQRRTLNFKGFRGKKDILPCRSGRCLRRPQGQSCVQQAMEDGGGSVGTVRELQGRRGRRDHPAVQGL